MASRVEIKSFITQAIYRGLSGTCLKLAVYQYTSYKIKFVQYNLVGEIYHQKAQFNNYYNLIYHPLRMNDVILAVL